MKQLQLLLLGFCIIACSQTQKEIPTFNNPEKSIAVTFGLRDAGEPFYRVLRGDEVVLDTSALGITRKDVQFFKDLSIISIEGPVSVSDNYTMLQGKQQQIEYTANQYQVHLKNADDEPLDIIFNLSDDGVAFRYYFPNTSDTVYEVTEEATAYHFPDETKAWVQPMSVAKTGWLRTNPSYEEHYLMGVDADTISPLGQGWVYPALFKTGDTWALISETDLEANYCGSRLKYNAENDMLQLTFPQESEVFTNGTLNPKSTLPFYSPWRIITIGSLKTIVESTLGTDLAAPAIDMNTSFIKPGFASWSWVLLKDDSVNYETTKDFIDYASKMNWPYCLVDADWNKRIGEEHIKELADYASTKGVKLLLWYNSSGEWNDTVYEPKSALISPEGRKAEFKKLHDMGIAGIKVDFFGGDGQSMIAYYHDILKDAAEYQLLMNFHGATLPRGWQRTYPHLMTTEAIKGEEFITFGQETADLQPSHNAMLPFTRNAFDPMDFTPMVLDSIPNIHRRTTAAFELALPIIFLSGIQHIAEIPQGMNKMPDYVVELLKDVPTDWTETRFLDGYPGKDAVIARRKDKTWFIAAINGENKAKTFTLDLSFIDKENGILITDADKGFFNKEAVNNAEKVTITVKPYGGFLMKF